ncbi:hypothetical protein AFEL58S_01271 [Afipia felis]
MHTLYVNEAWWQSVILTLVLGGGGAWLAGRAIARTWRGIHVAVLAAIPMAMAVRFVHFALFEEPLLSPLPWLVEAAILLAVICLAFQHTRARQMVRQYYWLYELRGPLGWKPRQDAPGHPASH